MNPVAEILFEYLRNVIYCPADAVLDVDALPKEFRQLGAGLQYLDTSIKEAREMTEALAKGELNSPVFLRKQELLPSLKSLQASLKHLTWQAQQIAKGDYHQHVDFMGDFAAAFNTMSTQLAERQQKIEAEEAMLRQKTIVLEQNNLLLTLLTRYVPHQIIVVNRETRETLHANDKALVEINADPLYIKKLTDALYRNTDLYKGNDIEVRDPLGTSERCFIVKTYLTEWQNIEAEIFIISDISATKSQIEALETEAYTDTLTQLSSRAYGMKVFERWLHEGKRFVLIFADLDGLKYINDEFGHTEGDIYIKNAAKCLRAIDSAAVVCRIGGDEFMALVPEKTYEEVSRIMLHITTKFEKSGYLTNKARPYSISYGMIAVDSTTQKNASEILAIADEQMYRHKRKRKKERMQ